MSIHTDSDAQAASAKSFDVMGRTVVIPVHVRDASTGTVLVDVDANKAAELIAADGLELVESSPGRAQMVVAVIDYRDNDLGDYLEIGISFFVRPRGVDGATEGTYIHRLPVDQEFTCAAGNLIWGFPKTVETIGWTLEDGRLHATLDMDGQRVLDVDLPASGSDEMAPMELVTYSLIDGRVHATTFTQSGTDSSIGMDPSAAQLEFGPHPYGRALAALDPSPPFLTTWTGHMAATFSAAIPVE